MSMGYDATAGLPPLNYTTSFTNPGQWTMGNNAYLGGQGQEVLGGILQNTQRSQQHTADLITSAAMAMPNSPGGAYAFSDTGGPAGGWGGNAFNQGAINNFMTGGGGYSFPSIPDYSGGLGGGGSAPSINWNTLFGGGGLGSQGFDLGGMQNWAGNWNTPGGGGSAADFGAGMFGGLAGGMGGAYQGPNNQPDYSKLFDGGGGPKTDPYPGMAWPGGQNSPMTIPQQQPPDYGSLFGQAVGGTGGAPQPPPYTSGIAPDETGGRSFGERFDALGGSAPMGDGAPNDAGAAKPAPIPEASRMSDALLGYTPREWPESAYDKPSDPAMDRPLPGNPYTDPQGGGLTAADLSEQARTRLAELVSGGPIGRTAESAREAGGAVPPAVPAEAPAEVPATPPYPIPLPRDRPEGADAPRPPADIPPQNLTYLQGKGPGDLKGVNQRFSKALQEFTREYNASQGDYSIALRSGLRGADQGLHGKGKAIDINLIDRRTGERLNDYQTRDPVVFKAYQDNANAFHTFLEKNYPDLAPLHRWGGYFGGGPGKYGASDLMHHDLGMSIGMAGGSWKGGLSQASADAFGLPTGGGFDTPWPKFNFDWSNAPIPDAPPIQPTYKSADGTSLYQLTADGTRIPVPIGKGMNETTEYDPFRGTQLGGTDGAAAARVPLPRERPAEATVEERPGVNQGQNVSPPPAAIPAAPAAPVVPKGPSGVEKAQTFLNRSVESILTEHSPENLGRAGWVMDVKQPMREALKGPFGSQILSGLQSKLGDLGLKPADFAKAMADPKAKFAEIPGGFGPYPAYEGPEAAPGGGFADFRQSPDVEDRRAELASLQPKEFGYEPGPEAAPTQLSGALGLGDLPMPAGAAAGYTAAPKAPQPFTGAENYRGLGGEYLVRREPMTIGGDTFDDFRRSPNVEDRREADPREEYLSSRQSPPPEPPMSAWGATKDVLQKMYEARFPPEVPQLGKDIGVDILDRELKGAAPASTAPPQTLAGWGEWAGDLGKYAGNPFVGSAEAADQSGREGLAKLREMFGGSEGPMAGYETQIDTLARGTDMPANTRFNLLSAAYDTKGKILDQVKGLVANQDWPAVDAFATSRLGTSNTKVGIQFGGAEERPVYQPNLGGDETTELPDIPVGGGGAGPTMQYGGGAEPASRADLASTMSEPGRAKMDFGGFSPSPEPRSGGVGPEMEAPAPEFLRTIAEAESSSNPSKHNKGSQYKGLFQLNEPEFRKYGGTGSIFDADQNAFAATGKMIAEGQRAQDILGRALSPVEQYMVHQQGLAGTLSHLRNPDQPAWKSFQQAASGSEERAKTAIMGNLSNKEKEQFGNDVNKITSRDFIDLWANKYLEKTVESGQPMTFQGGFSRD